MKRFLSLSIILSFLILGCPGATTPLDDTSEDPGVIEVSVTGVSLDKTAVTLYTGRTELLTATVTPVDATNKNVVWTTSNSGVATVSTEGIVSGVSAGSAVITVTTTDGSFTATCNVTVEVAVTGVTLNKSDTTILINQSEQLSATVSPSNATDPSVTWSSDNESVATVNSTGLVLAGNTDGTANITVTTVDGGYTAVCGVTVTSVAVDVTGVSLNHSTSNLIAGGTVQLLPTVTPAGATNQNVTWLSADDAIATVNSSGLVTGVGNGTVNITVTTVDGGFTADCAVTVTVLVTGISLDESNKVISVSSSFDLTETITPAGATNTDVTWTSSDETVATVDGNGTVTGVANGTATITATTDDGGFTASCIVTVGTPVSGVTLDQASGTINAGETLQLVETVAPATANNKNVTWASANNAIATVNSSGLVTGVGNGTVNITVTTVDGGFTADCAVTVIVPVLDVNLSATTAGIGVGSEIQLTATVVPSGATNQSVTWSSSDDSIATVDASGLVTGVATGSTDITATTVDGGFTATCTVTVVNHVTGVEITLYDADPQTVEVNNEFRGFGITFTPDEPTNMGYVITSSNPSVVSATPNGIFGYLLKGESIGTSEITVTTDDGGFSDTFSLEVIEDTTAPAPGMVSILTSSKLFCFYFEPVSAVTAGDAVNYTITGSPSVEVSSVDIISPSEVNLNLSRPLVNGEEIEITFSGIEDLSGNELISHSGTLPYSTPQSWVDPTAVKVSTGTIYGEAGAAPSGTTEWDDDNSNGIEEPGERYMPLVVYVTASGEPLSVFGLLAYSDVQEDGSFLPLEDYSSMPVIFPSGSYDLYIRDNNSDTFSSPITVTVP